MKPLVCLSCIVIVCVCVCAKTGHHGNSPTVDEQWIADVGLLFPDVALVLGSSDSPLLIPISIDCNPVSVGRNHFWMFFYHLPPPFQQHEAGCWLAYDDAVAECMSRAPFCGAEGLLIQAGTGYSEWEAVCIAAAAYERDNNCPPPG